VAEVGDPGLGLDALVHAVTGDDVDVLQPADQSGQEQERQNEGSANCQPRRRLIERSLKILAALGMTPTVSHLSAEQHTAPSGP